MENVVIVQKSIREMHAQKIYANCLHWQAVTKRGEIHEGIYYTEMQAYYRDLDPGSTWKSFVSGWLGISYTTCRKRQRAAEWVNFGASLGLLSRIDCARLEKYIKLATEDNYEILLQAMLPLTEGGMSEPDFIKTYCPEKAPKEPKKIAAHCPRCHADFDLAVQ